MIYDRREFTVNLDVETISAMVQNLHQERRFEMTIAVNLWEARRHVKIMPNEFGDIDFCFRRLPLHPLSLLNRGRVNGKLQRLSQTHTLVTLNIDNRLLALRTVKLFLELMAFSLIWVVMLATIWSLTLVVMVMFGVSMVVAAIFCPVWYVYHHQCLLSELAEIFGSAVHSTTDDQVFGSASIVN